MSETLTKRVKSLRAVPTAQKANGATATEFKHSYAELSAIVIRQEADVRTLQNELVSVKEELRTRDEKHEAELTEAVLAARQEERSALQTSSKEIIDAGIESLKSGRQIYDSFLQESGALSLSIAEQALLPVFKDPVRIKATLASAIAKSIHRLGQSSVLNVRLNADDFGDPLELIALEPDLEKEQISFEIDPTLQSGESVFELLIGQYEISLPEHWLSLQKLIKDAMQDTASKGAV